MDETHLPAPFGQSRRVVTPEGMVFARTAGSGPPVLLLHGFPETGLMWRDIAPLLAADASVIIADLPGYGASDCPKELDDPEAMSKRRMADTLVAVMATLGHARFAVVDHDRGGRVAYRMALDHPDIVTRLAVLDMVPTLDVWELADARLALSFWPFSLLAQQAPLPERLILGAPDAVVDSALAHWGTPPEAFPASVRNAYIAALQDARHVHAICQEYRAAATIDRDLDQADRDAGRKIGCPLLALWSGQGALSQWYENIGGPLALWRRWALDVHGQAMDGGHFFP